MKLTKRQRWALLTLVGSLGCIFSALALAVTETGGNWFAFLIAVGSIGLIASGGEFDR